VLDMKSKDKKGEIITLLAKLKDSLIADGFSEYSLNIVSEASRKIEKGHPIYTEARVVYQNLMTASLAEKNRISPKSERLLKQIDDFSRSRSIWSKINDLMTANTWLGK